jgi:AraC-like DNA-binding protein
VFYLEPSVAGADALSPLVAGAHEVNGALVGQADAPLLRSAFELRPGGETLRAEVGDVMAHARRRSRRSIDARISRSVATLQAATDAVSVREAAAVAGLSASRFQHLFTREVGVPFRRYRAWQRLRAAIREVADGSSLTAAAHAAGFADQAHFTRSFRRTFGAPPSRGL